MPNDQIIFSKYNFIMIKYLQAINLGEIYNCMKVIALKLQHMR